MELLERNHYLEALAGYFRSAEAGTGHIVFLGGEAGAGKTSLVNHFVKQVEGRAHVYTGACDSLFTPRPLGPLFDIAADLGPEFINLLRNEKNRSLIFAGLMAMLAEATKPVVIIFEDTHWADEATIDLIKFLARRISRYRCLFMLTYRDEDLGASHPLSAVFGEISSANFSRLHVNGFSRDMVERLAAQKGFASGEQLYTLTGGNPFYVMEILAGETLRVPERVKDSILTLFHSRPEQTRALWEFLSILPSAHIEPGLVEKIEGEFAHCIDRCIEAGVIISRPGYLSFKHELFRMAIEESLSPSKRKSLHKKMLEIMQQDQAGTRNLARLVHHARCADEKQLVARMAPQAAQEAAAVGAHIEASRLYDTAITYTESHDPALAELYERHAYECYLTNQVAASIRSQQLALEIWRARKARLKIGDMLRFLSRLWWFAGDQEQALDYALQSIEVLENGFPTRERAMAYSNLSQLYMLSDNPAEALLWGDKAIVLAERMEDHEILSHALNNVGTVHIRYPSPGREGDAYLNRSLSLALQHGFHEHAARAYTNLSASCVLVRQYEKAMNAFHVGLPYCEDRDLNSWTYYMLGWKARLMLETGRWNEADTITQSLLNNPNHTSIVRVGALVTRARLAMRRGSFDEAEVLLEAAMPLALPTREGQRILPVLTAQLELCWLRGSEAPATAMLETEEALSYQRSQAWHYSEWVYWMRQCGVTVSLKPGVELTPPFQALIMDDWETAAERWSNAGCPYELALSLFEGDEEHQKRSLRMLDELGATATHAMLKSRLRLMGVRNIPRGPRESTRSNPAQLTNRQIDVLHLLEEGLQNAEIANKLFISSKTVDHHISAILSKLGMNSRAKAVTEARRLGILA